MSGNAEVYEVQTLNNGRWTIQSRCRTEQQAIAEAHEFYDRRQCIGAKVVREAFDATAKVYRESIVFRLPTSTGQAGSRGRGGSTTAGQGAHGQQNASHPNSRAGATPLRELGDRLLAVMPSWVRRTPAFLGRYISLM